MQARQLAMHYNSREWGKFVLGIHIRWYKIRYVYKSFLRLCVPLDSLLDKGFRQFLGF